MFWGLMLKANRKYTQTTRKSFHISQAALDCISSSGVPNQLFITFDNQKTLICTLHKDKCEQVPLDLNFAVGDEVSFQTQGDGVVHLSGYLTDLQEDYTDEEEEQEESEIEDDAKIDLKKKAKKSGAENAKTAVKGTPVIKGKNDNDEDDSEFNGDLHEGSDEDVTDEDSGDGEEDEYGEDSEEDSDNQEEKPIAKKPKLEKTKQNGVAEKKESGKKGKKDDKEAKQEKQRNSSVCEKTLTGGIKIEDLRIGNGPDLKAGKRAHVFYEGRLKSNNKVFDSMKQGSGFKFVFGRGQVIKGWDIGVAGMKVGGKRRITCPPHMGYGGKGSPPQIPPNSTLVFEVELKGVH